MYSSNALTLTFTLTFTLTLTLTLTLTFNPTPTLTLTLALTQQLFLQSSMVNALPILLDPTPPPPPVNSDSEFEDEEDDFGDDGAIKSSTPSSLDSTQEGCLRFALEIVAVLSADGGRGTITDDLEPDVLAIMQQRDQQQRQQQQQALWNTPGLADALMRLALPPTHTQGGSSPAMEAELALTKPFRLGEIYDPCITLHNPT